MSEEADRPSTRPRTSRARPQLPVIAVTSREEMAVMLALHGRLLREYARHYLPNRGDEAVEDSIERTVAWLLAIPKPSLPHGLRYATKALWRECQRTERRLKEEGIPTDRVLGPVTGELAKAVDRLGPRSREVVMEAARGRTSAEIAESQNTTPQAVRIRLYHARKRLEQFLAEGRLTASGFLILAGMHTRRTRGRLFTLQQRLVPVEWPNTDALAQLATVTAAVVACSLIFPSWGSGGVSPSALAQRPPLTQRYAVPRAGDAVLPPLFSPAGDTDPLGTSNRTVASANLKPSTQIAPVGNLLGRHDPASETPEDTQFMTAAAPADFASTPTIIALGVGASCVCPVLFQSLDGGATWTPSPMAAPAGAEQVALSPTYPADPRIFIGTNPQSGGSIFVIPQFGQAATPLPAPAGHIALAADFGRGDDRLFVAAQGGVMTISTDAPATAPTPILLYPQWFGTASIATPHRGDGASALVLAPPGTYMVGSPSAAPTQAATLFACGAGASCAMRSLPPATSVTLTASPSDAVTAVSWAAGVAVSGDGGRTFNSTAPPSSGWSVQSVAENAGKTWVISGAGSSVRLLWASAQDSHWSDATGSDGQLGRAFRLAAFPGGPVLAFLVGRGLRCTVDGGSTWQGRCP